MSKLLSSEDTLKCLRAWQELEDQNAVTILITSNQGLVRYFVKKYLNNGLSYEELKSAGDEGLFIAINKFNYNEIGIKAFSSYAGTCIENTIRNELRKFNKHSHVLSFSEPIGHNKDGEEMTVEDIIGTDGEKLISDVIAEMKIDVVRDALNCLTRRERQIILLRYGLDDVHKKTLEEVAEIFNCSKQTIMIQEKKAITKMRHPRNTKKLKDFAEEI